MFSDHHTKIYLNLFSFNLYVGGLLFHEDHSTYIVEVFKLLSAFCLNLYSRHMVWGLPKSYRQSRPLTPRKPVALLLHRSVFRKSDQVLEVVVDYLLLRKERHRKPKNPIRKLVYKWLNAKFCCHQKITSSLTE